MAVALGPDYRPIATADGRAQWDLSDNLAYETDDGEFPRAKRRGPGRANALSRGLTPAPCAAAAALDPATRAPGGINPQLSPTWSLPFHGGRARAAGRRLHRRQAQPGQAPGRPDRDDPHTTYAEPFVGMGGVFLRRRRRPAAEVINDWRATSRTSTASCRSTTWPSWTCCASRSLSRAEFERLIRVDPTTLTDMQRAARFLYLQRTAFGGKVEGRNFGVSVGRGGAFDVTRLGRCSRTSTSASPASSSSACPGRTSSSATTAPGPCSTSTRPTTAARTTTAPACSPGRSSRSSRPLLQICTAVRALDQRHARDAGDLRGLPHRRRRSTSIVTS
jgi:hypothetical protein